MAFKLGTRNWNHHYASHSLMRENQALIGLNPNGNHLLLQSKCISFWGHHLAIIQKTFLTLW